jgi:hypothetical protein
MDSDGSLSAGAKISLVHRLAGKRRDVFSKPINRVRKCDCECECGEGETKGGIKKQKPRTIKPGISDQQFKLLNLKLNMKQ